MEVLRAAFSASSGGPAAVTTSEISTLVVSVEVGGEVGTREGSSVGSEVGCLKTLCYCCSFEFPSHSFTTSTGQAKMSRITQFSGLCSLTINVGSGVGYDEKEKK